MPAYVEMFEKAFPNEPSPVSFDNFAKAVEAFEATLITPASPFDQYLEGDGNALNQQQKTGLKTFMEKGWVACHNGINVGGQGYFPFGVVENPGAEVLPTDDKGRFNVSRAASDEYVFPRQVWKSQAGGRRDGLVPARGRPTRRRTTSSPSSAR